MHHSRSPRRKPEIEETFSISSLSDCDMADPKDRRGYSKFNRKRVENDKHVLRDRKNSFDRQSDYRDDRSKRSAREEPNYLQYEQNLGFFQNTRTQIETLQDPSITNFQVAAVHKPHSGEPFTMRSTDEKTHMGKGQNDDRSSRRSINEKDRGNRTQDKLDGGGKRSIIDRLDYGDRRYAGDRKPDREREKFNDDRKTDRERERFHDRKSDRDRDRFADERKSDREREREKGITIQKRLDQGEGKSDDRIKRLERMVEILVENKESKNFVTPPAPTISNQNVEVGINSSPTLTTSLWLNKINEECLERNFDEVTCINFVQTKMSGLMKAWFKTLNPYEYTWPELKMLITKTFPDTFEFATTLHLLVDRIKKPDETVTQYYFAKMYLIESCKISGPNAVSCLIDGLADQYLQKQAREFNFLTPENLYSQFLIKIPNFGLGQFVDPEPIPDMEIRGRLRERELYYSQEEPPPKKYEKDMSKKKCFTCGKTGHIAEQCRHAPICYRCNQKGHIAAKCSVI